jgi:alkyldihydroxyacetonephosphate synthase
LPASGAGPSPERFFAGSEGALGVVTEAWMRLQERPRFRASATVRFADFLKAAEAARALAQSGLYPTNARLLDAEKALVSGAGDGTRHLFLWRSRGTITSSIRGWRARSTSAASTEAR